MLIGSRCVWGRVSVSLPELIAAPALQIGDRVSPLFAQSFISGLHDPNYQKNGLGGGIDGVIQEYFMCDQVSQVLLSVRRDAIS